MIPLLDRDAVRALDTDAVERLGVPSLLLMENAGRGALDAISRRFGDRLDRVVVVGGTGQNGGDGWALARLLAVAGHEPRLVFVGDESKVHGDARVNLEAARRLGLTLREVTGGGVSVLGEELDQSTLVVDALLGTGLDRDVTGLHAEAIRAMCACRAPCVALDVPSGVDASTGAVLGSAVTAAMTVTFAAHKRGLYQYPGAAHAGEIVLAHIGVPPPSLAGARTLLIEACDVAALLPRRAADAHKGTAGHVLVLAGSPGKTGAALLVAHGAARAGSGLVTIAARPRARRTIDMKVVECMTAELSVDVDSAVERALELARRKQAAAVGPGLGTDDDARKLAVELAMHLPIPTVLDADALTAISGDLERLRHAAAPRVLTPHPAEAARLLGVTVSQVQADRYTSALRLAERTGAVVALKGACTVVASPEGDVRVCPRGTVALGAGGTGDVLTGVVVTLLATLEPLAAASAAVFLHALAGELAAESDRGMLAREVADALPKALEFCRAACRV